MVVASLPITDEQLADYCRRHGIRRLALFGSVLRDDFGPGSDVDVLVDFEPGDRSFRALLEAKGELSALLGGRKVDLIQRSSLNRWVRARVFAEEEVIYDRDGDKPHGGPDGMARVRRRPSVNERDELSFGHMLDNARRAIAIAADADRARFEDEEMLRLALTHLVQIVGESARKVSPEGRAAHPEIPWQQIVGMRTILVHNDADVHEPKVWEMVVEDLPPLVTALEAFLVEPKG
jgi:uncharacterized protein with HEPN domain/predicted nucleotidyltransferase